MRPDVNESFDITSNTRTYNHIDEYAIEDGVIWFRKRSSKNVWQPIFFDGFPTRTPIAIDVDGANLIVRDDKNFIHYKKVLKEYRAAELKQHKSRHFDFTNTQKIKLLGDADYVAVDKSDIHNWKSKWFSLPGLHYIVNLFQGKRLRIPVVAKAVAISHRGRYNDFIEDAAGQKHPVSTGVTTLYVLDSDGRSIHKFDPWSPKHADVRMYFPETSTTLYAAETISASASTIMAIGYEADLKAGIQSLKIMTKLGDIDTEGWNPGLKYSYTPIPNHPNTRVLPIGYVTNEPEWMEHALPQQAQVTSHVTIRQTGKGNTARELFVEGKSAAGEWGFFHKRITDQSWQFTKDPQPVKHDDNSLLLSTKLLADHERPEPTVHSYTGTLKGHGNIQLTGFGERTYHSKLILSEGSKEYTLNLHKRHGLASFIGIKHFIYEVEIPTNIANDPFILKIFPKSEKNGQAIHIKLKQHKNGITIITGKNKWKMIESPPNPAMKLT